MNIHTVGSMLERRGSLCHVDSRAGLRMAAAWLLMALATLAAPKAHAEFPVSDASAQAVARQLLQDYELERKNNVGRWSELAHDEGGTPGADCPVSREDDGTQPVSFKDCNLEYFKLRAQRWAEVLQGWAVLDAGQKANVAHAMAPIFESLQQDPSISLAGQTVAKAYQVGDAAKLGLNDNGLLGLLGIGTDTGSVKLNETLLNPTFAKGSDILDSVLAAHSEDDIEQLSQQVHAFKAWFPSLSNASSQGLIDRLKETKYTVDTQKNALAETANISRNSQGRADVVRDITSKIKSLGNSGADQSLVSAKLAQYEFYLAALDALGREEMIKSSNQRSGERAQDNLVNAAYEAKRWNDSVERARGTAAGTAP